jgi:molybdenum cofactor biosynthesis protein MoaC
VALNSPNPLHSPLHVPLPSNAISVRTYHSQSKSPIDDSRERDQVLGSSGEYMQAHVEGIAPRQHDQVLLQAVWERGIVESPLPENFEIVRRRYSMAGCEYNSYWRLAARSQLTGDAYIVHASAKARHKLRKIVQARVKKDLVVPRNTEGEVPSHGSLMNEAQRIADWPMKRNNEGNGGVERGPQDARDVSRDVEGLLADMEKHVPKSSMLESLGAEVQRLEDRVRTGQASRRSKRSRWRENKKLSKLQEEREAWKNIESDQRNIISELRSLRIARKKQSTAEKSQKFEQSKRLRELQTLRLDLLRKKRELLQQLEAEKNAQQIAEKARYEAEYRTRQSKEQSTDLGDVLDVALEKTIVDFDLKNSNSQKDKPPIVSVRSEPEITNRPFFRISLPTEEAQTQIQEARNEAMTGELINSKVTGDSLRFNVPESGKIPVDPEFTILLNGDTDHLQNQLNQMQTRLRASYPRIDTLPYDISQSKNRKTLQTWLKIMAGRWQTRSNHTEDASTVNTEVKAVLDQMVRDHDLSNSAANRMAKRWSEIFDKRDAVASSIEPTIDWNEFSAGGMDFLKANDVDGIQDNQRLEAESVPLEAEIITVSNEADARREKSTKDNDQCESDANSMTVMETGHVGGAGKDDAQQSEHTTPKATHLTTHKRQTASPLYDSNTRRLYSTLSRPPIDPIRIPQDGQSNPLPAESQAASPAPSLPHLTPSGSAHMVSVSTKAHTIRSAIAVGTVYFSNPTALGLIKSNSLKKGDVLSVSRIAGIMAAKKCPDLIPLCHPIPLTHVGVELQVFGNEAEKNHGGNDMGFGGVMIEAKVSCTGPTGVEMEALTSVMGTALSVVDMCKAVDKFQRIQDVRVVLKEGGKSGTWAEEGWKSFQR